jgi:hypothetical protein
LPNLPFLATSYARLELRPLPSTGVTRLPRYCWPLRHPVPPSLSLAGVWLDVRPVRDKGLPVLHRSSCADMPSPISRRIGRVRLSLASPTVAAFPEILIGSASALLFSGPAQRSLTLWPASSPAAQGGSLHRRLQPLRYLHDCSDYYRLERQLPGGSTSRWKTVPLHGAQNQKLICTHPALSDPWATPWPRLARAGPPRRRTRSPTDAGTRLRSLRPR